MPSATPKYIQCCVFLWIETVLSPSTYIERQRNRRWTGGYGLTATHSSWTWLPPGLNQATVLGLVGKLVRKLESISLCGESNMSASLGLQLSGCVRMCQDCQWTLRVAFLLTFVQQFCNIVSTLDATNGTGFASICILEPFIWMTFPTMEAEISNKANEAVKGELLSLQKF